jgi:hypothetical protein
MGKTLCTLAAAVGTTLVAVTTWYLFQGPILDGTVPPLPRLTAVVVGFLVGVAATAWGTRRYIRGRREGGRPTPPRSQV